MVEMIEPYKGRVYDPACGSGGMLMSEKFIEEHQGNIKDITIYGQESNQTTWKLSKMNLAIRNINSQFVSWNTEGSFRKDTHPDLKADFILANPPFNQSDWGEEIRGRRAMEIWHTSFWKCQLCLDATYALSSCATRSHGNGSSKWFAFLQYDGRVRYSQGIYPKRSRGLYRGTPKTTFL